MVKLKVIWSKNGSLQLKIFLKELKEKSPKAALKVKNEIFKTARSLSDNLEIYSQDRFKKDNDGSFRAFEQYNYRVTYQVEKTQVIILQVRHTSRDPLKH